MKFLLLLLPVLFILPAYSQQALPDNFKIGESVEVFSKDSIKIYFTCNGVIADTKCADYYRVGKMDTIHVNVMGAFYDYYKDSRLCLKATMKNNMLEGKAEYYYTNGALKETGNYEKNKREGRWTFYYPNGDIRHVYYYRIGEPLVLEAYMAYGKATASAGSGEFTTEISREQQCNKFKVSGKVVQGQKHGSWTFAYPEGASPITTEVFDHGKFIKGIANGHEYYSDPKVTFTDYIAHEHLLLSHNTKDCQGPTYSSWDYAGKYMYDSYFPPLQDKLAAYKPVLQNQWLVVGLRLSRNNKIDEIHVASSINDEALEQFTYTLISQMTSWTRDGKSSQEESNFFFSILVENNQIIIPVNYISLELGY